MIDCASACTGKINKITLTIDRPKLTPEDEKKLMAMQRNNKSRRAWRASKLPYPLD